MRCCTSAILCFHRWLAWGHHARDVASLGVAATTSSSCLGADWLMACPSRQKLTTHSTLELNAIKPCIRWPVHCQARCASSPVSGSGRTTGHLANTPPAHCCYRMGQRGVTTMPCRSTARRMPAKLRTCMSRLSQRRSSTRGLPMSSRAPSCVRMHRRNSVLRHPTAWVRSRRSTTRRSYLTWIPGDGGRTTTHLVPARRTSRRPTTTHLSMRWGVMPPQVRQAARLPVSTVPITGYAIYCPAAPTTATRCHFVNRRRRRLNVRVCTRRGPPSRGAGPFSLNRRLCMGRRPAAPPWRGRRIPPSLRRRTTANPPTPCRVALSVTVAIAGRRQRRSRRHRRLELPRTHLRASRWRGGP